MLNNVQLIGNLGADPEVRTTQGGSRIVNMRLATNEKWTDKASGEKKERVEWHSVVIFNEGLGKVAEQYLKKGSQCYVSGQLRTRKWEKDGVERYSTEIVLAQFNGTLVLLGQSGGGRSQSEDDYGTTRPARPAAGASAGSYAGSQQRLNDLDDDIPF